MVEYFQVDLDDLKILIENSNMKVKADYVKVKRAVEKLVVKHRDILT